MHEARIIRSLGVEAPERMYFFNYEEGPPAPGHVRLETLYSGFSAGTELTLLKGSNPYLHARWDGERGLFVEGEPSARYPLPFLGYMESARILDGAEGFGRGDVVGATYGHKSGHTADPSHELLVPLPGGLDPVLGIFIAQMGPIAANGILHADAEISGANVRRLGEGIDGRPVIVMGAGTVGMLTALFARSAGAEVVVAEPSEWRRRMVEELGLIAMTEDQCRQHAKARWHHGASDRGADVVFQTRARSESLHCAFQALRPQGSVIDLAFYQGGAAATRLGEEFHHNGLNLRCAQIGRVPRGLARQWDRKRLSAETVRLLQQNAQAIREVMITHVVPIDEAPAFVSSLIANRPDFVQIVFDFQT